MNSSERNYEFIPSELKALRQWVVCGSEYDRDVPKRPFNPLTSRPASVTDPSRWVTFDEAVASGATSIGFVLTADDPFFVVDLDTYKSQVPENHERLLEAVETYAERSQSGAGAHIIGKGIVGQGRNSRFHGVEIYDRDRFIIMTGNRISGLVTVLRRSPERLELAIGDRRDDQAFRRVQAGGDAYSTDQRVAA